MLCFRVFLAICAVMVAEANYQRTVPAGLDGGKSCKDASCCAFSTYKYRHPNQNCYTGTGHRYGGTVNVTRDGRPCMNWREHGGRFYSDRRRRLYDIGDHNYCRNPDEYDSGGPWCYVDKESFSRCDVIRCSSIEYGPLYQVSVEGCETKESKFIKPDVMFMLRGQVYYVTHTSKGYMVYKYDNANFTSLGEPSHRMINQSWNLCASEKDDDIMTFASSFDDVHVHVYFQRPNTMLKIDLANHASWSEVPDKVFEECTSKVVLHNTKPVAASTKQVFSIREPKSVFLLAGKNLIRCEWDNGILKFINSTASPFGDCPTADLYFTDGQNKTFQLFHPSSSAGNDEATAATIETVNDKPALAFPLLNYEVLNKRSLVKLARLRLQKPVEMERECAVYGKRSRIFQMYDGHHLDDVIRWLRTSSSDSAWLRVHKINIRKSSYCAHVENISCCNDIRKQVVAWSKTGDDGSGRETCFHDCKLRYTDATRTCPVIFCDPVTEEELRMESAVVCEIPLEEDPPCSIAVGEILHRESGISYGNAEEAAHMMETIAAAIVYQTMNDSKVLTTLVNSVQALEKVNYTALSSKGAENLILDVVNVFDNIVDEKRTDAWITLHDSVNEEGDQKVNEATLITEAPIPIDSTDRPVAPSKRISPSQMLFTMESVLRGIAAGQDFTEDLLSAENMTLSVETGNVVSVIQRVTEKQQRRTGLKDLDLTFEPREKQESPEPPVAIVSKFPKLINLIEQVENGKKDKSPASCPEGNCLKKMKLEYINNSPVISATMLRHGEKIESGVTFAIPYEDDDIPDPRARKSKFYFSCRFLSETMHSDSASQWDESGCRVSGVDYADKVVYCSCNHTTNFAILLQVVPPEIQRQDLAYMQLISYIGESVSVFCLVFTMATFLIFRHSLKSARMVAHFHLVIALLIFHVTQLLIVFAEKEKNSSPTACIAVTAVTHFSLLSSFCWMLCEGILLHMSVVSVFNPMTYMKVLRYLLGWGIPALIAGGTLAYGLLQNPYPTSYVQGVKGDVRSDAAPDIQLIEWCWLSSTNYLVWAMAGPAVLAIAVNTVILLRVTWVIARTSKATNMFRPTSEQKKDNKHIRKCLKGAIILMPILGIPWIFGLIPQASSHVWSLYAFTILNSMQGFFIMLFYCILSAEVRTAFFKCLRKHHMLYSVNWSSHYSGRNSGDDRSGRRRSETTVTKARTYSRQQSAAELIVKDTDPMVKRGQRILSTATTDTEQSDRRDDDVFEKCCNNNSLLWYNDNAETRI